MANTPSLHEHFRQWPPFEAMGNIQLLYTSVILMKLMEILYCIRHILYIALQRKILLMEVKRVTYKTN